MQRLIRWVRKAVGSLKQRGPNEHLRQLAEAYKAAHGITSPGYGPGDVDVSRAKRIADAYQMMPHNPEHPMVRAAYDALKRETLAQYQHLLDHGYQFTPYEGEGEPYPDSAAMMHDLRHNRHMHFFTTVPVGSTQEAHFGSDDNGMAQDHPLLEPTGYYSVQGHPLLYNDVFRAVHDAFGHATEGHQFGAKGEENAWRKHAGMYSPLARAALTSETRGQNSWVNFGPHIRRADGTIPEKGDPDWIHPAERPFAEQKAGLLAPEFWHPDYEAEQEMQKALRPKLRLILRRSPSYGV